MDLFHKKSDPPAAPAAQVSTPTMSTKPSGFVSFLDKIGLFFEKAIAIVHPIIAAGAPFLNIFAPGVGTAVSLVDNMVASVEAQFQANKAPAGSGAQKSAQVLAIL